MEYVAAIAGVGLVMLGLLVVRPYVVPRKDPVGAVPYVVRLLGAQARPLEPRRATPAPRRHSVKRRRGSPRPRVVVKLPEWLVGR